MQRLLVFVFLSLVAASAVRAQSVSGGGDVQESIGRSVTLRCTYSLSTNAVLREIKWYRRQEDGSRESVLVYLLGDTVYTYGLYRNRASLVNTDPAAQEASLRLSNLQFSDNGTYECLVGAGGNGVQPSENSVEIELVALVAPNDPVITDDYNTATRNLTLTCTAYTGNPAAYLTWTRDGSAVTTDTAENITSWRGYLDAQSTISVTVSSAQSSAYECVARHPAFPSPQRASVTLRTPRVSTINVNPNPTVEQPLQELDDVILTCMTQEGTVPQPTYQWQHNGGSVPASAQAYRNELKIFSAQMEDSGTYTCTASNTFGSDNGETTIQITERVDNIVLPQTGTPAGTVVGIVVAVLAAVAVLAVIGFVCWRRRQSDELKIPPDSPEDPAAVVSTEPEEEKDEEKLNLMEEKKEEEPVEVKVETQGEGHAEVAKKPDPDQTA